MGRAMVLGLMGAGVDVMAVGRNAEALGTLSALAGDRGAIETLVADLREPASFAEIARVTLGRFGRLDILVNNAAVGQASIRTNQRLDPIRFWETTPEQWSEFVAVNATAPIMLTRAALPHMLKAGAGRIITITTSLGTMVREGQILYGPSKAAAEAAMAVLAADLKTTGVTSNVLVPGGATDTPFVGDDLGDRAKMLRPEIMVPPLLWLISEEARDVNGKRFIAADWDVSLPPAQAAARAGSPIAWLGIARMPIRPG